MRILKFLGLGIRMKNCSMFLLVSFENFFNRVSVFNYMRVICKLSVFVELILK